jgi:hypothetical protein
MAAPVENPLLAPTGDNHTSPLRDPPYFRGHAVRAITVQSGKLLLWIKRGREMTMTQHTVGEASELRRGMAECSLRNEINDALVVCAEWQRGQPATHRTQ